MIKKIAMLIGAFGVGVITCAVTLCALIGHAPAMVYANALEASVNAALKVRLGIPGDVDAVRSLGIHDFVWSALRKVQAYYEATGTPVPDSVASAIATLPVEGTTEEKRRTSTLDAITRLKVGDPAPVVSLKSIDGRTLDLKDKVVVLNFFKTSCGPCMAEIPRLEKDIWEPLQDKGIVFIAIGQGHSALKLESFQKQKHFPFPFVEDPKSEIYDKFAANYVPRWDAKQ